MIIFCRPKARDALGKEEQIVYNISAPLHMHLIGRRRHRFSFDSIFRLSKRSKTKRKEMEISIIDRTSEKTSAGWKPCQDVSDKLLSNLGVMCDQLEASSVYLNTDDERTGHLTRESVALLVVVMHVNEQAVTLGQSSSVESCWPTIRQSRQIFCFVNSRSTPHGFPRSHLVSRLLRERLKAVDWLTYAPMINRDCLDC